MIMQFREPGLALRAHSCASGRCNDGRRYVGFAGAMVVAMAMDALVGWPAGLFARIGHPVTWLGALIDVLDARCNRNADAPALRRTAGIAAALRRRDFKTVPMILNNPEQWD